MIYTPHTAEQLGEFARTNTQARKYLEATERCLRRHWQQGDYKRDKALELMQRCARDVARLYAMDKGENLAWPAMFPRELRNAWCERVLDAFEHDAWPPPDVPDVPEVQLVTPLDETPPEHNAHVEGDEYVCLRCKRRWDLNDREIPPCE